MEVIFLVQGSAPEPYETGFRREGDNLTCWCTCPAGEVGQYCKHRFELLRGDGRRVVSQNLQEVEKVPEMLHGTDVEVALARVAEAEAAYEHAKRALSALKKALARAMND